MKRGSTLFLKIAVILIGIPVLALCIFFVPEIANFAAELYPDICLFEISRIIPICMQRRYLFILLCIKPLNF